VVPIDLSAGTSQECVEDCPVCCHPKPVRHVEVDEDGDVRRGRKGSKMLPLYEDPHFTFRFVDDRIIPRFHLEGVEAGRRVSVFKINPSTGERLGLLATATVNKDGWVDLPEPIIVRAGEAFVAVPEQEGDRA
jgi:hypothetical protein